MPSFPIHTVDDALRIVSRYSLRAQVGDPESFAAWLFHQTVKARTEHIADHVRRFKETRAVVGQDLASFDMEHASCAYAATSAFRAYEKQASDLLWLVRSERTSQLGRATWSMVSRLAVTKHKTKLIKKQPGNVLLEVRRVLQSVAQLNISVGDFNYIAGEDKLTDEFMCSDLERIEETLSDAVLWRDDENLVLPTEVSALARLATDESVLAALDATLSEPAE